MHAFYDAAHAHGGTDDGPPGPRPRDRAGFYGAFVLDPVVRARGDGDLVTTLIAAATLADAGPRASSSALSGSADSRSRRPAAVSASTTPSE